MPVQLHDSRQDPFRSGWAHTFLAEAGAGSGLVEAYLDYPGAGHLFTDRSLPAEFDRCSAELLFARALDFVGRACTPQMRAGSV